MEENIQNEKILIYDNDRKNLIIARNYYCEGHYQTRPQIKWYRTTDADFLSMEDNEPGIFWGSIYSFDSDKMVKLTDEEYNLINDGFAKIKKLIELHYSTMKAIFENKKKK